MAALAPSSIHYLILLFGTGAPMFFGPFASCTECKRECGEGQCRKQEEALRSELLSQRKIFPQAKTMKLTFVNSSDITTEPIE